ncbi:Transmembrane protein 47 [Caenorhabditis elegans]|uniref:Transmembrane protein 47 n=1 Tax=Caenorhabditis elegans TaxID=6239 RepID=Q7YTU3_CAEEL|nr:Transmembrane protein 47 [Caenorhabditis elegans]CAD92402.1 Transmembrane protein 47 [Caenorhabditis elegans]|eukprot:NP_001021687.1 Uncharacterized protein CELE_Y105E8A.27 [Caenorhabditis elegans]
MRLFVLLRSVFFVTLLAASLKFITHSQLCINYEPHDLWTFMDQCQESIQAIAQVSGLTHKLIPIKSTYALDKAEEILSSVPETMPHLENETIVGSHDWYRLDLKTDEQISINSKTCFEFTIHHILQDAEPKFSHIISPLRLTLILMVTSLLIAILDLSSRMFLVRVSVVQCIVHTVMQMVIWGSILLNMGWHRRVWQQNWLESGQTITEIPVYPEEWLCFEIYAFLLLLLPILDCVLFEHLRKKIRMMNSEGVYKCIQKQ